MNKIVEIIVFDDGNDEFKECENIWKITKLKLILFLLGKHERYQIFNTQNKLNVKKSNLNNDNKDTHTHTKREL